MNILLLRPAPGNERFGLGPFFRIEPLGMEYVAAALGRRGHQVTIRDLRFSPPLPSLLTDLRPDVVGIACMHALEIDDVLDVVASVRKVTPGALIVVGGHSAAAYPAPFFEDGVDAICLDDGERAVPALVDAAASGRPLDEVPGWLLRTRFDLAADTRSREAVRARRGAAPGATTRVGLAAPLRLLSPPARVSDRNGTRVPVPLLVLFRLATVRPVRARAVDRQCLSGLRDDR